MEASHTQPHTRPISEAPCDLKVTDESQMKASHGSHCSSHKHGYIRASLPAGAFQGLLSAVHGLLISKQDGVTDADVGQEIPDVRSCPKNVGSPVNVLSQQTHLSDGIRL